MTFDDSDGPPVAREGAELLDAETLPLGPDNRAGLDDSHKPPVATEVAVNDDGHEQGRAHDPALITLYLNDIGRVALLTHERERELIASLRATRVAFVRIALDFPVLQEAILDALEPLLPGRVAKSPAVARELIRPTALFRPLHRVHRTGACPRAEMPRARTWQA